MSCDGCVQGRQDAPALLADARESLRRSQVYLRPTIRPEPRQVTALRGRLAGLWRDQARLTERLQGAYGGQNLGLIWIAPAIAAAGSVVAMIGAWAWKHREQAREVELRAELYNRMIEEGLTPDRAAALAMGAESALTDVLRKLTVLVLVAGGIYIAYRVLK